MIFAKLDVDITDHPKAIAAGPAAFGLWVWSLAYCRKHESDGDIPLVAVRTALGGSARENMRLAAKLVKVGLWADQDGHHFVFVNYAKKNETRHDIDARRTADRSRKVAKKGISSTDSNIFRPESENIPEAPAVGFPGSGSGSDVSKQEAAAALANTGTMRDGTFGMSAEAWREGVAAATGSPVPTLSHSDVRDVQRLLSFAGEAKGEALLAWAKEAARTFAVRELADNNGAYGITPRRAVAWFTSNRPPPRASVPNIRAVPDTPPAPYHRVNPGYRPPKGGVDTDQVAAVGELLAKIGGA